MPSAAAPAFKTAAETAAVALPPSFAFASGTISSIVRSISRWLAASSPFSAGAMISLTFRTAPSTPLPRKRSPPSKSKWISCVPMEMPDVHMARPVAPFSVVTTASTPGLPRFVYTCLAVMERISVPAIFSVTPSVLLSSVIAFIPGSKSRADRARRHLLPPPRRSRAARAAPTCRACAARPPDRSRPASRPAPFRRR